jgi:hypothetical protein
MMASAEPIDARATAVMAITKCLISVSPVNRFTVAATAMSQCDSIQRLDGLRWRDTTTRELIEAELDAISGGSFVLHASTHGLDAVAKAPANMAPKQ